MHEIMGASHVGETIEGAVTVGCLTDLSLDYAKNPTWGNDSRSIHNELERSLRSIAQSNKAIVKGLGRIRVMGIKRRARGLHRVWVEILDALRFL
jgi:hypothetical protein